MPRTARQRRGQRTAALVAEYLQPVAPGCYATPTAYAGNDMKGCPWDVEVKAPREDLWQHREPGADHEPVPTPVLCGSCGGVLKHTRFSVRSALRQAVARRRPEHILPPMVVLRPDGTGDESVGEFIVMRRFEDDRALLEELLRLRKFRAHWPGGEDDNGSAGS